MTAEELKTLSEIRDKSIAGMERALKRLDVIEAYMKAPMGSGRGAEIAGMGGDELARRLFDRPELKAFVQNGARGGIRLAVDTFEKKTVITSSDVTAPTQRLPAFAGAGVRRIRVRDLLPSIPVINGTLDFVRESVFTNAASPQVEGSAKGESSITFTLEPASIKTLAHWLPASKQILSDLSGFQSFLNERLLDGLADEEDEQLLLGDGTGQNLEGLTTVATAYDTALNETGDTQIDKVNNAITQLELSDFRADGVILNPRDWRRMNKIKDQASGIGNYVLGGPGQMAGATLWGLPVATTTALPLGKFLVGAFRRACVVADRMSATIDISDSHDDYFVRNLVAIRAEERLALVNLRPDAVIYGTF